MTEAERIAAGLSEREAEFLINVCDGRPVGLGTREADKARQKLRRAGLVAYCGKPVKWQAHGLGLAVRALLKGTE